MYIYIHNIGIIYRNIETNPWIMTSSDTNRHARASCLVASAPGNGLAASRGRVSQRVSGMGRGWHDFYRNGGKPRENHGKPGMIEDFFEDSFRCFFFNY